MRRLLSWPTKKGSPLFSRRLEFSTSSFPSPLLKSEINAHRIEINDDDLREVVLVQDFRPMINPLIPPVITSMAASISTFTLPKILLTCEHASNRLPRPYNWSVDDQWVKTTHWAYDIGAFEFAKELAQELGVVLVSAQFSRLLVDPNRPLASETLFRQDADGKRLDINRHMTKSDRNWRIWHYYLPFHQTLGEVARKIDPRLILSIHSFNPSYEGSQRDFDLGVLCTTEDHLAAEISQGFEAKGYKSRINMPWSGKEGFMYSADSLKVSGTPGSRRAIMVEMRNDLVVQPLWRKSAVHCLVQSLRSYIF